MRKLMIAMALVLLLAACGGTDDNEATPPETAAMEDDTAMADESMADESMSDESMSDESMSDESMADDSMSDESMSDESISDESMSDESMADDSMSDESMEDAHSPTTFRVTITNTSDAAALATPIAPGTYAVHSSMETLFAEGAIDRNEGLEELAEDGDPSVLAATLTGLASVSVADVFNTPDGAEEAGPAGPGASYSFTFAASPGDYLSFATMFVQSNDWFFAPSSSGIALFDGATPLVGDITDQVALWDAGTEVDEVPGEGENQAPRQSGPNSGDDQNAPIVAVTGYDGSIAVTITTG